MRLFGIIGLPLGHSFSQKYFTEKFLKENLSDHSYCKFELSDISQVTNLLENEPDLAGFNVTIPYKLAIMSYLDEIDPVASEIGAVNTVKITRVSGRPRLKGFNTDAPAFRASLLDNLSTIPDSAVVLGTGGASKSVVYVLNDLGIRTLIVSRKESGLVFSYGSIPTDEITSAGVIVNTTPVGMSPAADACPPLDYSLVNSGTLFFDLIYNPAETLFMQRGMEMGCPAVNGEAMFRYQAEMAWKIWNDSAI